MRCPLLTTKQTGSAECIDKCIFEIQLRLRVQCCNLATAQPAGAGLMQLKVNAAKQQYLSSLN